MFTDGPGRRRFLRCILAITFSVAHAVSAMPDHVILFIGDGMGEGQVATAGMYATGAAGSLSFEAFPYQGSVATGSASLFATDSAAAATAMATGRKVFNGVISMAQPGDGSELQTVLEYAAEAGKSTGLVTSTGITSATPAAFGAHERSRDNTDQIAADYLEQTRPNVLFGGGDIPSAAASGYTVIRDAVDLGALDTDRATFVSGQFDTGFEYDRAPASTQPHLSEMTAVALDILDNDPEGFFLMVEGGRIDSAAHDQDIRRTVEEVLEFSRAVQTAVDWAREEAPLNTLILVTADHETGGLIAGAGNGVGQYPDVTWTFPGHTGANVPIYGWGVNSWLITSVMDNTDVFSLMMAESPVVVPVAAGIPVPHAMGLTVVGMGLMAMWRRHGLRKL